MSNPEWREIDHPDGIKGQYMEFPIPHINHELNAPTKNGAGAYSLHILNIEKNKLQVENPWCDKKSQYSTQYWNHPDTKKFSEENFKSVTIRNEVAEIDKRLQNCLREIYDIHNLINEVSGAGKLELLDKFASYLIHYLLILEKQIPKATHIYYRSPEQISLKERLSNIEEKDSLLSKFVKIGRSNIYKNQAERLMEALEETFQNFNKKEKS